MMVPVGDKLVDYNENFVLFMATRNSNIDLPPDAAALITQVYNTNVSLIIFCIVCFYCLFLVLILLLFTSLFVNYNSYL